MLKLGRVNFNNLLGSAKEAIINRAIAYNKAYTLLHRQLVQKERVRYYEGVTLNINKKTYKVVREYNIKSSSTKPYIPYSKENPNKNNLGLNQLFVGQDPYKKYEGNPKSGIYHDECSIYPRRYEATELLSDKTPLKDKKKLFFCEDSWGWEIRDFIYSFLDLSPGFVNSTLNKTIHITKKNDFGFEIVASVKKLTNITAKTVARINHQKMTYFYEKERYKIVYTDKTEEIIEVTPRARFASEIKYGEYKIISAGDYIVYANLTQQKKCPPCFDMSSALKHHGQIIYKARVPVKNQGTVLSFYKYRKLKIEWEQSSWKELKESLKTLKTMSPSAKKEDLSSLCILFADNTCILLSKGAITSEKITNTISRIVAKPPSFSFVALVHADTNELALSKKEFVENWEKYFELYVYERKSFWQKIAAPLVAIVTMIIAPYLTYLALPVGATLSTTVTFFGISTTASFLVGASAFFATVGLVGSFARVPFLKVIGTIGGIGVGMVNSIWSSATTKMLKEGSLEIGVKKLSSQMVTKTAVEASKKVTFGAVLNYIKSSWLNTLNSVLQIINASASLSKEELEETKEINENERNKIVVDDEDEFIRPNFIQKVIDIPKLDGKIEKIEEMEKWEQTF